MTVPDALIEDAARRFALLSDPTRLRVLQTLLERCEATVTELAEALGIGPPKVSQHLARLLSAGTVSRSHEGRSVRYGVADLTVSSLCELVCSSLRLQAEARAGRLEAAT
jgi:DNA-binding transcriptional ArsR family regulator